MRKNPSLLSFPAFASRSQRAHMVMRVAETFVHSGLSVGELPNIADSVNRGRV
jgi:hypothetical protein